jgi:thioredoxin 1
MKTSFTSLIKSHPLVMVDFFADWCGPCKMLAPNLKAMKDQLGEEIKVIKIDVDKNPSVAAQYQVRGVPTILLFKNGEQVWRQSGVLQTPQLLEVVNSHK